MAGRKVVLHILGDEKDLVRALTRSSAATRKFGATTSAVNKGAGQTGRALVQGAAGGTAFARGMGLASASMLGVGGLVFGLTESVKTPPEFGLNMQRIVGLSGVAQSAIAGLTKEVLALRPRSAVAHLSSRKPSTSSPHRVWPRHGRWKCWMPPRRVLPPGLATHRLLRTQSPL